MSTGEHRSDDAAHSAHRVAGLTYLQWGGALAVGLFVTLAAYQFIAPEAPRMEVPAPVEPGPDTPAPEAQGLAERILAMEALTKRLSKRLGALEAALNGDGSSGAGLFTANASGAGLIAPEGQGALAVTPTLRIVAWGVADSATAGQGWLEGFLGQVTRLKHAHLEIESGLFTGDDALTAESLVHIEVVGEATGGHLLGGVGQVRFRWQRTQPNDDGPWRISAWRFERFYSVTVQRPLFVDALPEVVDAETRQALERSEHAEKLLAILEHGASRQPEHPFAYDSLDRHPGLAVVDINRDGWDDLYVMPRWGTNQLLINQGGERFVEAASTWGLDIADSCSSAIFADFDNDGDADVMIGRTLKSSLYLVQEDGRFTPAPDKIAGGELPKLVSSVSVVDYDSDGLLDVYFSTYAATMVMQNRRFLAAKGQLGQSALRGFLSDADAIALGERIARPDYAEQLNRPGPPNRLYRNTGEGRFERVESPLSLFRNTFQATWSDVDGDGDSDVYLANDHSGNHLFRNDEGRFIDVTEATGTADFGFGMGVTWGDYDNDGRIDLYTSNMYSRAGRRITGVVPELDPRMRRAARGNTLFRNASERFEKTSSLDTSGLEVERAGWSWGAQFGDLDNDGFDDLYVLNGHYSAPEKVAIDHDS
ncbi:MAG: FG-GAP repeat domain-containing protein [Myxococcota bacterium]